MKEFGVMHECVGCKNAMIDGGGQYCTDARRQRMVSVAMSNGPKHTERLESCMQCQKNSNFWTHAEMFVPISVRSNSI